MHRRGKRSVHALYPDSVETDGEKEMYRIAYDVEAVITSFNQGEVLREALQSLCSQTLLPSRVIIVDDGSTDETSIHVLEQIQRDMELPVPVSVIRQSNSGVSAARNTGLCEVKTSKALILDGDDRLEPEFLEKVSHMLREDPSMVAASSWMQTFGVLDAVVKPSGGPLKNFLSRNCCPASHILRREAWETCGGYDESMRSGFEDWDFFLNLLETGPDAWIGIVPEPLLDYRTAPASANVKSMSKRLELMHYLIDKHFHSYQEHLADAILGIESISMSRLDGWEQEMLHVLESGQKPGNHSEEFLRNPSYGDGGMAAAVRIASRFDVKASDNGKE